jgi:hypothetical protein
VRFSPRLRRSTVATPALEVRKLELVRLYVGVPSDGIFSSSSWILATPDLAMSSAVSTCTGADDCAPMDRMREPVISTRWSVPCACAAPASRPTPPTSMAAALPTLVL